MFFFIQADGIYKLKSTTFAFYGALIPRTKLMAVTMTEVKRVYLVLAVMKKKKTVEFRPEVLSETFSAVFVGIGFNFSI